MPHTILVGLDNSYSSWHAYEKALEYAARSGAHMVGLVVESPLWTAPRHGRDAFEETVRINAESLALRHGVPLTFRVRHGYPAHTIADQARLLGCDLVVLGHAGDALLRRFLTTSVSGLVRHEAPCRVVVVRTGQVLEVVETPLDTAMPASAIR